MTISNVAHLLILYKTDVGNLNNHDLRGDEHSNKIGNKGEIKRKFRK
jgi:hypothetical protein